jgi:hypothetical protein
LFFLKKRFRIRHDPTALPTAEPVGWFLGGGSG